MANASSKASKVVKPGKAKGPAPKRSAAAAIPVGSKGGSASKYEKVEMPSIEEAGLDNEFEELGDEATALLAKRKDIDEKLTELKLRAQALMEEVKDEEGWSARGTGWSVSYVKPKPREKLIKELLISQGVSMEKIKKATKVEPVNPFVVFRLDSEEE